MPNNVWIDFQQQCEKTVVSRTIQVAFLFIIIFQGRHQRRICGRQVVISFVHRQWLTIVNRVRSYLYEVQQSLLKDSRLSSSFSVIITIVWKDSFIFITARKSSLFKFAFRNKTRFRYQPVKPVTSKPHEYMTLILHYSVWQEIIKMQAAANRLLRQRVSCSTSQVAPIRAYIETSKDNS